MSPDTARQLLDLTVEYQASVAARDEQLLGAYAEMGRPTGRDPQEIAVDYARVASRDVTPV